MGDSYFLDCGCWAGDSAVHLDQQQLRQYVSHAKRIPRLDEGRMRTLSERVRDGDAEARAELVGANLMLVVTLAWDFKDQGARCGMSMLEMVSEGNVGLARAVEKFRSEKGAFSSYAAWGIKQAIWKALQERSTIRVPNSTRKLALRVNGESCDEIVEREGCSRRKAHRLKMAATALRTVSMDSVVVGEKRVGDEIVDSSVALPFEALMDKEEREMIPVLMSRLTAKQREVIRLRFGLDGKHSRTLSEAGAEIGLCGERVRQIQNEALARLREMVEARTCATAS